MQENIDNIYIYVCTKGNKNEKVYFEKEKCFEFYCIKYIDKNIEGYMPTCMHAIYQKKKSLSRLLIDWARE